MDRLGTALNPDIDVPLDGDLPRSRKVNVSLNEEAVRDERILQLIRRLEVGLNQRLPRSEKSSSRCCIVRRVSILLR